MFRPPRSQPYPCRPVGTPAFAASEWLRCVTGAALTLLAASGCSKWQELGSLTKRDTGTRSPRPVLAAASSSSPGAKADAPSEGAERKDAATCLARRKHWFAQDKAPGAPTFEARRAEILGRAKSEPVLFLREPRTAAVPTRLLAYERSFKGASPVVAVAQLTRSLRFFPEDLRLLLLREGYVYSSNPALAASLTTGLRLRQLFREKEIFLQRGAEIMTLRRDPNYHTYVYTDGPQAGRPAAIYFGDRVGLKRAELAKPLHVDLAPLMAKSNADELIFNHLAPEGAAIELRYGDTWVLAAAKFEGAKAKLECLVPPKSQLAKQELRLRKAANQHRRALLKPVRGAMRKMVAERLRFDEPLKEEGQQDGSLRPLWRWAYDHGGHSYSFNGVGYSVFDRKGRPWPPQVCIDFVLDAYERGSGTWYGSNLVDRERRRGGIDFERTNLKNRRSAASFAHFAETHPNMFDVWSPSVEERVPFAQRGMFFRFLERHRSRLHAGDIVIIHGYKPDGKVHYHSFIIDRLDPVTGVPVVLIGNAGRPRIRSWESVMRSAPLRSIKHIVHPKTSWLTKSMGVNPRANQPLARSGDGAGAAVKVR